MSILHGLVNYFIMVVNIAALVFGVASSLMRIFKQQSACS